MTYEDALRELNDLAKKTNNPLIHVKSDVSPADYGGDEDSYRENFLLSECDPSDPVWEIRIDDKLWSGSLSYDDAILDLKGLTPEAEPEHEPPLRPLTVTQLKDFCEQEVAQGHGDKIVLVTDDDEANGFHALWYPFCSDRKSIEELLQLTNGADFPHDKIVLLG